MRRFIRIALAGLALAIASTGGAMAQHGQDPNKLSLGVQATGTVKWELAAMAALGIDKKHLLELDVRDVADSKAGQIALQAKEVDVILSDFVWVSIQRHEGNMVTMVPHSLTVGGLMVDPAAGINSVADLGVSETPPLLGWTFFDETAHAKKEAIKAFLDASFETKKALLEDDGVWDKIRDVMNVGDDDKLFAQLRDDYRAGIVTKYASSAMQPAEQAFELMARYGGADVVGSSTELADGTFYKGYRK